MNDELLESFDTLVASRLARIAGEHDAARIELVAHVVSAVRDGHVCLDAELHARRQRIDEAIAKEALENLRSSPLVRLPKDSSSGAPLVADAMGRIYLARYFDHEQTLARRLVALARGEFSAVVPRPELVDSLFPPDPKNEPDLQRKAALGALGRGFTIISGGPGTGKTSTVVKLLALLADASLSRDEKVPRVLLLAPTGKAAARLGESIRAALQGLRVTDEVREAIPTEASTIHRALGVRREGGFVHGVDRHLAADLVLVDEASMVDLALMRATLDAIAPGSRLVLLGDRDQLASVEAGSVLADLCVASNREGSAIHGSFEGLVRSYRFSEKSGIGALARAIRAGDVEAVRAVLEDPGKTDVALEAPLPMRGRLPTTLQRSARDGYAGLLESDPKAMLESLARFRVLTAHRKGALGVTELGGRIAASIGRPRAANALGTPILVLENDFDVALSNGDVGVVGHAEGAALTTYFPTVEAYRSVSLARLPRHETCWAMSIHKSQGSEFDEVAVVLPEGSELSNRELFYTAVTRAKKRVVVYASNRALETSLGRSVVRSSGLVDALVEFST